MITESSLERFKNKGKGMRPTHDSRISLLSAILSHKDVCSYTGYSLNTSPFYDPTLMECTRRFWLMHSEFGACFEETEFSALLNVCSKHLNCVSAPAPIMHRSMLLALCFRV